VHFSITQYSVFKDPSRPHLEAADRLRDLRYWLPFPAVNIEHRAGASVGGADRDRTDDLKLAKLALSQLSYSPLVDRGGPR
jgi:hypothetical protein